MPSSLTGFSFLYPVGLWALAAIAIPIIIHLFNRSRGRLVKIGHIDLIRNARKLKVTEMKPADWLLLFLRVCLFALAALILAGLALPGLSSNHKPTAYVSPAWFKNADPTAVAELLERFSDRESSSLILLANSYPAIDEQVAAQAASSGQTTNIWPLIAERLSLEDHQESVDIYAVDSLAQFGATIPALPRQVNWNLVHNDKADIDNSTPVAAIVAFDASRKADADVIGAALNSIRANRLTGLSWKLVETKDLTVDQQQIDWLFLLSDDELNAEVRNRIENASTVMLSDANGASRAVANNQVRLPFYPFSEFNISRIGEPLNVPYTLLTSADHQPLLQQSLKGGIREVHFNSRFVSEWSTIAQQPEFPETLLQMMIIDELQMISFAGANVLSAQLESMTDSSGIGTPLPHRNLQSLLAALMALIWLLERWLSERKRRVQL